MLAESLQVINSDHGGVLVVFGFQIAEAGAAVVGAVVETTFLRGT